MLEGIVKSLGNINNRDWDSSPTKSFEAVFSLVLTDKRLKPGLSGDVEIITEKVPNAVFLPLQAVIDKDGKKWAYVAQNGGKVQRREITVGRRSENQIAITKGLDGTERVAFADPDERAAAAQKKRQPLSSSPGGEEPDVRLPTH